MASMINERVVIIPSLQQSLIDQLKLLDFLVLISSIPIYNKYKDLVVTTCGLDGTRTCKALS